MDLKHITTRLENPQAEYWSQITQAQLNGIREDVQTSWAKYENLYLWLSLVFAVCVGGYFYWFNVAPDWKVNARLATWGVLVCLAVVVGFLLFMAVLWLVAESFFGNKDFCERRLKSLEDDPERCAYALKLSEVPEVNKYRLRVLERGRNLIVVDVAIMANISKEVQEEKLKTEHKSSYQKLHEKTDITGAA